jgi:hypothetical protein
MIFLEGKSEYSNWGDESNPRLKPHHSGYTVAIDNKVYWRSCGWHNFNQGKWHVVVFEIKDNDSFKYYEIEPTPEQYLNPPKNSRLVWASIYNYKSDPNYPSNDELEDMFNIEFESYIQSLTRDSKLNSILDPILNSI